MRQPSGVLLFFLFVPSGAGVDIVCHFKGRAGSMCGPGRDMKRIIMGDREGVVV